MSRGEYFDFLDDCYRKSKERPPGYELIPDVRNDPVSVVVSLVLVLRCLQSQRFWHPSQRNRSSEKDGI